MAPSVRAQVNPGFPPMNDFANGKFDSVNIGSRNIFFSIPIRQKAGAIPFSAALIWNNSMGFNGRDNTWAPPASIFSATAGTNNITYSTTYQSCGTDPRDPVYSGFSYIDTKQTFHGFGLTIDADGCFYPSRTVSGTAGDGSGYYLTLHSFTGAGPAEDVWDLSGIHVLAAVGNAVTDTNGNSITGSTTTDTDTLGQTVLTINNRHSNGTPDTYSYTDALGATRTVTVNYSSYTEQTNFGCYASDFGPYSAWLPSSISMPDGSSYGITYEPTPGYPNSVTGRIAKITLPTGGSISYSFTGGSHGIDCQTSQYVPILTRTLTNSDGSTAVWKYDGQTLAAPQVLVTDPYNNDTVYTFGAAIPNYGELNSGFESQKLIYSGSHSTGTLLKTVVTCYNGNTTNCATTSPMGGSIITEKDTTTTIAGMSTSSQSKQTLTFTGLLTRDREYDFGASTPTIDRTVSYGSYSGGSCLSLGATINNRVCTDVTKNGTGTVLTQTNNSYDANGNLTTESSLVSGSTYLTKSSTHNANGTVATATDVNGAQSTPTYGACNGLMPTSIAEPLSLSISMTWDCNGGVMTAKTDENGQTIYTNYFVNSSADPFYRPLQTKDALGNITNFTYSVNSTESAMLFNSGASTVDVLTTFDGFGQAIDTQKRQAPGSANWDTVSTAYDLMGRVASVSQPCTTTAGAKCPATPATLFQYDAVSRPILTTDAGNGTVSYSYSKNDTLVVLGPAPAGENTKSKQNEYDGLGRLASVCELTSATGSGNCAQATSQTGYWTKYTYDTLNNLTGVTQDAQGSPTQGRTYSYDDLGRMLSEVDPESNTTQYFYDTAPSTPGVACPGTYNGDLVKTYDANGNTTCYTYDGLHRELTASYPAGPNSASTAAKTFVYDATTFTCSNGANVKSRLAEAFTGPSASKITDIGYCYSPRGKNTDLYESTPHSGGYYHTTTAYWANGILQSLGGVGQQNAYSYAPDGEGRLYSATQNTTNYVSATTYNAGSQPLTVSLFNNNGDNDTYTYDSNTGRMATYTFTVGATPQSMAGTLTWNANGTLSKLAITDGFNASGTETCKYGDPTASVAGYDDLSRIISANCGTPWSQSFSYDPFGNITKSGSITWMPGYNQSTNRYTLGGTSYDSNGNLLNDSFHSYAWDANNHPVTITSPNGSTTCGTTGVTCLTYDAMRRMVEKNVAGTFSEIEYGPTGKVAVMNGHTTQLQAYVPLPGGEVLSPGPDTFWHTDWLGSARLATSAGGRTATFDRAFAPFGEAYDTVTGGTSQLDFTGLTRDTVSDEYDTENRELHPNQGRWISPDPLGMGAADPINPQSWNLYAFVMNNPLALVDADGLDCATANAQGVTVNVGDCPGADPNNEYYIDCDGCLMSVTGFSFSQEGDLVLWGATLSDGSLGKAVFPGFDYTAPDNSNIDEHPYATAVFSQPVLQNAAVTMNDPRTYAAWFVGSATLGYGLSAAGAFEGGLTTLDLGVEAGSQATPGQVASISRTAAQSGRRGVEKALRKLQRRLAEHLADLERYKQDGGPTSYTVKEIANFRGLIQAAEEWLSKNP
jgi:RHS repeat-associated protein